MSTETSAPQAAPPVAGEVPLDLIVPDPRNPRPQPSASAIRELAESIRIHGLEQPIVLSSHPDAEARASTPFMILHGERRYLAFRALGRFSIPAVLRSEAIAPAERLLAQLAENDDDHRHGIPLLARARAYAAAYQLSEAHDQASFAVSLGKTRSWLAHLLWIAEAEGTVLELLEEGLVARANTARAFARLPPELQGRLLERARQTRQPVTEAQVTAAARLVPPIETDPPRSSGATPQASRATEATSHRGVEPATPAGTIVLSLTAKNLRFLLASLGAETAGTLQELADRFSALMARYQPSDPRRSS